MLRSIPDLGWYPEIPSRFANYSRGEIQSLTNSHYDPPIRAKKFASTAEPETNKSWPQLAPQCFKIRDQGKCGACYAFAAVGVMSDWRCISQLDQPRVQYSEQYQISCDRNTNGCDEGGASRALNYLKLSGTPTEKCLPYQSGTGYVPKCNKTHCADNSTMDKRTKLKDFAMVRSELPMMQASSVGVMYAQFTIYDDFYYFNAGKNEIYSHKTGNALGMHAVEIVGYGELNGVKYWEIKNSYGEAWGQSKGYFKMLRGTDECGIESTAAYLGL